MVGLVKGGTKTSRVRFRTRLWTFDFTQDTKPGLLCEGLVCEPQLYSDLKHFMDFAAFSFVSRAVAVSG